MATGSGVNNHDVTDTAFRARIQGFLMISSCKLGIFVPLLDPFLGAAFPFVVTIFSTSIALYVCFALQSFLLDKDGCVIHGMCFIDRLTMDTVLL